MVNVIFLLIKAKNHEYTLDCNLKEIKDITLRKICLSGLNKRTKLTRKLTQSKD